MINIVVAYSENRVIGRANKLPWNIPEDLKRFKKLTTGHTVIMGRKTCESIVKRLGHVLPNRRNIVISTTMPPAKGVEVIRSLKVALDLCKDDDEVFILGGEQVFKQSLVIDAVDRIYATEIHAKFDGDTYFPKIDNAKWRRSANDKKSNGSYKYSFVTMERQR